MGFSGELGGSLEWRSISQWICAWFGAGGEARLQALREINRRYGWMVGKGSMPPSRHRQRDATGERSVSLAKMVLYYNTHLAEHLNSSFYHP